MIADAWAHYNTTILHVSEDGATLKRLVHTYNYYTAYGEYSVAQGRRVWNVRIDKGKRIAFGRFEVGVTRALKPDEDAEFPTDWKTLDYGYRVVSSFPAGTRQS